MSVDIGFLSCRGCRVVVAVIVVIVAGIVAVIVVIVSVIVAVIVVLRATVIVRVTMALAVSAEWRIWGVTVQLVARFIGMSLAVAVGAASGLLVVVGFVISTILGGKSLGDRF